MNLRRWLLVGAAVAVVLALAAAAGGYFWWYRPRVEDARALSAVQLLQLQLATWNVLHQQGASGLPAPYPARLEDLVEHGLVDEPTLDFYQRTAVFEYLPPPGQLGEEARLEWLVLKATTPRGTWIGTLGGDRRWEPAPEATPASAAAAKPDAPATPSPQ